MGIKKINIVSSSIIVTEGLRVVIQQLTGNHLIENFLGWYEFLENFDRHVANQTIFVDVKSLPKRERLKTLKHIINNNVTVILLYINKNEVEKFHDYVSIPFDISKEDLLKNLNDILIDGEQDKPINNVLSERETTILKEVALGLTNKEISDKLYISMHTVITHRKNIAAKLGIRTISGLTVYAIINNIISPTDMKQ